MAGRRCSVPGVLAVSLIACISGVAKPEPLSANGIQPPATQPHLSFQELKQQVQQAQAEPTFFDDDKRFDPTQLMREMRAISDHDLQAIFDSVPSETWHGVGNDLCLTEISSRGGAYWQNSLSTRYARMEEQKKAAQNAGPDFELNGRQLAVLMALRRVQKKDDPLVVLIQGKSVLECNLGYLPEIVANLTNLDAERRRVSLETGGDYRGAARHNKWRIQAYDGAGKALPEIAAVDMGGIMQSTDLEFGESISETLPIGAYVSIEKPGTYTLVVMYHPEIEIANISTADSLICPRSIRLTLTVTPITIETTDAEQASAAALIKKLPTDGTVKILGGMYSDTVNDFMPKDSPAAQLKQLGWNAVPELISSVNGKALNPTQRAWALGLLYSITDQQNPMDEKDIVGPFEYRHSGWVQFGNGPGSGQSASRASLSVLVGNRDEQAQMKFAKGWKPWIEKGYIKIVKNDQH